MSDQAIPGGAGTSDTAATQGSDQNPAPEEEKAVTFSWGLVMVRTKKLLNILDNLARFRVFKDLGWVMIGITVAAAAFMVWLMLDSSYILLTTNLAVRCAVGAAPASQCHASGFNSGGPPPLQAYLLLPGINPYIPVVYGLIGIIIAVVIHEGTHGVIARSLHLPVKSTGVLFFLIVPIGAFVEIDEKLIQKAKFRDSGRIMAGGPGSNVIVGAIALILLLLIVGGLVPHQFNGVYIDQVVGNPLSPALTLYQNGQLHPGDLIVGINDTQIHSTQDIQNYLATTKPNETVTLVVNQGGQNNNYTVKLGTNKLADNKTIGFIGIGEVSTQGLNDTKNTYANAIYKQPLIFLEVPGITPQADSVVPFSNALHSLYTSPILGDAWYPISLTLFWIFFININLAFFNAIPLYPLDGGQAILNFFSHFGRKWVETRAKLLTGICSGIMFALILTFLFLPRILSLIPLG